LIVVERERKKAEKQAKFDAKKKQAASAPAQPAISKNKEKKAKAAEKAVEEVLPEYVEETPFGEKKRTSHMDREEGTEH
jgi:valyl-tRNA synthetase